MCRGNLDLELKVAVFDYNMLSKHVAIGELKTSVNKLINMAEESGKKVKKSYKSTLIKNGDVTGKIAVLCASVSGIDNLELALKEKEREELHIKAEQKLLRN